MSGAIKSVFKGIKKVATGVFNVVRPMLPVALMAAAIAAPYLAPLMMNGMGFTAALGQLGGSAGFWGSMISGAGGTLLAQAAGMGGQQAMAIGGLANGMFNALGFSASTSLAGKPASGASVMEAFSTALRDNKSNEFTIADERFKNMGQAYFTSSMEDYENRTRNAGIRLGVGPGDLDSEHQDPYQKPTETGTPNSNLPPYQPGMSVEDMKDVIAQMNKKTWKDYAVPIGAAAVGGFLEGSMAAPAGWSPLAPVFDDKGSQFVYMPRQKGDLAYGVWEEHVESKKHPGSYIPKYKAEGVA